MASPRKRWRLQLLPWFTYERASSKVDAYRRVEQYREAYARGHSRVDQVNVQVYEVYDWQSYEQVVFPLAGGSPTP